MSRVGCGSPRRDEALDGLGQWTAVLEFRTQDVSRREVGPAELRLGELAHGALACARTAEHEDHVGFGAGLPGIAVMDREGGRGGDAIFVDVPLPVGRWQVVFAP